MRIFYEWNPRECGCLDRSSPQHDVCTVYPRRGVYNYSIPFPGRMVLRSTKSIKSATFRLSIRQLIGIWIVSIWGPLWVMPQWTFVCKCLCGPVFPTLRGVCLRVALLGRGGVLFHILRAHPADFQSDGAILHALPPEIYEDANFPISSPCLSSLFYLSHPLRTLCLPLKLNPHYGNTNKYKSVFKMKVTVLSSKW